MVHFFSLSDRLHISLYKDGNERYKNGQEKAMFPLEEFYGIESGFSLDKEQHVMAIVCQDMVVLLALYSTEVMIQWEIKIRANLGEGRYLFRRD